MNQLLKKMKYIDQEVSVKDWTLYRKLVEGVREKRYAIIDFDYKDATQSPWNNNEYYKNKLFDKSENNFIWSTFQNCVYLHFLLKKNSLYCTIEVYNFDRTGHSSFVRFILTVDVGMAFIDNISANIEYYFNCKLEDEYQEYLHNKQQAWIKEREKAILDKGD